MSENPREIATVKEMFESEGCKTYADVYNKYGLLGEGTILAHCVHLEEEEKVLLRDTKSGVSHCPASNLFVNSGAARVRDLLKMGIKVRFHFVTISFPSPFTSRVAVREARRGCRRQGQEKGGITRTEEVG